MNNFLESGATPCPACDSISITESMEMETFSLDDEEASISVSVPVMNCASCNFSYTDVRAEKLRHAAVCEHHGLLRPEEVQSVRSALGMSRREFGEAFGIPQASMERWENGKIIQNTSLDTLLRALKDANTAARLDRRKIADGLTANSGAVSNVIFGKFETLQKNPEGLAGARVRAQNFMLRTG